MSAIYRVDFPATALGVEIGPSRFDEVMARPEVFAAIPAPPFGPQGPELLLRDLSRKLQVVSRAPSRGVSFCVEAAGTTARRGGNPTRCSVAVQSLDPLVEAGAVVAPDQLDYTSRSAIVLRRDGGLTFAASRGTTAREFAQEIIDSTDGSWAAATSSGDGVCLATRQGVILGNPAAVADAWLVARLPAVSPTRMAAPVQLPELVPASRAVAFKPSNAADAPPSSTPRPNGNGGSDMLPIVTGIALLFAAYWWYQDSKKDE